MTYQYAEILSAFSYFFWPFLRISSMLMVVPLLSHHSIPMRVKVGLSTLVTLIAAPTIAVIPTVDPLSLPGILLVLNQILIGIMMGTVLSFITQIFIMAGQLMAMQSGLGFASLIDPVTGNSIPLIAQLYILLTSLIFLLLNGHLLAIQLVVNSFDSLPIGLEGISTENLFVFAKFFSWVFKMAILVAMPVVISLLLTNLGFGILTRAAPQLNIFALGFPITLTFGIFLLYVNLSGVLPQVENAMNTTFAFSNSLLQR